MKALDIVGQKFGRLTVLRNATMEEKPKDKYGKPKARTWCICKCDCGKEIIVLGTSLTQGNTTSCGCYQKEQVSKINGHQNLIGKKFGKLTVIKKDEISYEKGNITWECLCDCGKITHVSTNKLNVGNTKSCGCLSLQKHIKDIINQKFGKLTVLELDGKHNDNFYYWKCKCDCDNIVVVRGNNLKTGISQSCGCEKSRGEQIVNKFLIQNNIIFKKEYSFSDLVSNENNPLKFDFCVLDKNNNPIKIIEVNGTQHFNKNHIWYSTERAEYDKRKREYCKIHNLPLLNLNYNKDDSIPESLWMEKLATFFGGNTN